MAKTPNYTPEQTEMMIGMYRGVREESQERRDEVVAEIAEMLGKTPRMIRSKLSREPNLYVPKVVVSKVTGGEARKKEELAAELVTVSGLSLVSAEKLNKTDLVKLIAHFEQAAIEAYAEAQDADVEETES